MEIKLTDKQKLVLEGIIRSCIFLIVMKYFSFFVLKYITGPIIGLIADAVSMVPDIDQFIHVDETIINIISIPALILMFFACFLFNTYVIAKFCGLFKYFSQFRFWKSFLILLLISVLLYYFYFLNLHTFKLDYNAVKNTDGVYTIIPAYIVFLFFNFLAKKIPIPFKQIGYFFSIEFYIDLYKKVKAKLLKN